MIRTKLRKIMPVPLYRKRGSSGIIMIVVIIIIMALAIVSTTIFSISMSQSKTSRARADQIVIEQMAKGAFWAAYSQATTSGTFTPLTKTFYVHGKQYEATVTIDNVSGLVTVLVD